MILTRRAALAGVWLVQCRANLYFGATSCRAKYYFGQNLISAVPRPGAARDHPRDLPYDLGITQEAPKPTFPLWPHLTLEPLIC